MSSLNDHLWQKEAKNRKQLRKWILRVGLILLALFAAGWAILTQPLFSMRQGFCREFILLFWILRGSNEMCQDQPDNFPNAYSASQ
jgi:hypothetical protein